jgi:hypothetical protein
MAVKTIPANATLVQQLINCGKPRCQRCKRGPSHGPYWYAYWKEGERLRSRYLGRTPTGATPVFKFGKTTTPAPQARAVTRGLAGAALRLIRRLANGRTGLAFVPAVVRELGGPSVAHPVLEQLARDERIELRPESGLARLNAEDLAACVPGPQRTRLSWARLIS